MKANKQITRRVLVTFETFSDATCVALAALGQSDKVIMRELNLTQGQIQYRLHKAKTVEGYANGYRVQWRNGESDIVHQVKRDILKVLRADIQARLPQQIVRPETKTVPV